MEKENEIKSSAGAETVNSITAAAEPLRKPAVPRTASREGTASPGTRPQNSKLTDDIYHCRWNESNVMFCRHPTVIEKYAGGQEYCVVPLYVCFKCGYAVRYPMHGGVSCGYKK